MDDVWYGFGFVVVFDVGFDVDEFGCFGCCVDEVVVVVVVVVF